MTDVEELSRLPVPAPGLLRSARCLAMADLGTVAGAVSWWARGLAVGGELIAPRAWQGRLCALLAYGAVCAREAMWRDASTPDVQRGASSTLRALCEHTLRVVEQAWPGCVVADGPGAWRVGVEWTDPSWMGYDAVHVRHRAALLRGEEREWYAAQGWREQLSIIGAGPVDLILPDCDPRVRMPRWAVIPERDWPTSKG